MINNIKYQFPIGYKPKNKVESSQTNKNILLYFNKDETDKQSGNDLQKQLKSKYINSINIGPNAKLEKIKEVLVKQNISKETYDLLQIRISGHSMALNFNDLSLIDPEKRCIGGKSLDEIYETIKLILDINNYKSVKIKLKSCETGIMPYHPYFIPIVTKEDEYNKDKGSKMVSQVKIVLPEQSLSKEMSSVEYIARKLKSTGYKNIEITGVNGILLENLGRTNAVVSRSIYDLNMSSKERQKNFNALAIAVESKNDDNIINIPNNSDLMHIRKFKVSI